MEFIILNVCYPTDYLIYGAAQQHGFEMSCELRWFKRSTSHRLKSGKVACSI